MRIETAVAAPERAIGNIGARPRARDPLGQQDRREHGAERHPAWPKPVERADQAR
jgi:hypothetical protein